MEDFTENEQVYYKINDDYEKRLGRLLPNGVKLTKKGLMFYVEDLQNCGMYVIPLRNIFKINI